MTNDTTATSHACFQTMRRDLIWCGIVVACICFLAAASPPLRAQQVAIRGSITSIDEGPVPGSVTIVEGSRDVRVSTYKTNQRGEFEFTTPWASQKRVVAKADGFVSDEAVITLGPGDREASHTFKLSRPAEVSGRVVDDSGVPVPGAIVRVRYVGEGRSLTFAQEVGAVSTDDFGYFILPIVAQGKSFVIDAVSEDRPLSSSMPLVAQADTLPGIVVPLSRRGYSVTGRVLDSSALPLANARVRLVASGDGESYSREERASVSFTATGAKVVLTDDQGAFSFEGVPSGKIVLIADSAQGRARKEAVVDHAPVSVDVGVVSSR